MYAADRSSAPSNAYVTESGDDVSCVSTAKSRESRPIDAMVLAVVFLLAGVTVGAQRISTLATAFSAGNNITIAPSYYIGITRDTITAVTAITAAIGLLTGKCRGWWMAIFHCYWRLSTQAIFPILGALLLPVSSDTASTGTPVMKSIAMGGVFLFAVICLHQEKIVAYFDVASTRRVITNLLLFGSAAVIAICLDVWWVIVR